MFCTNRITLIKVSDKVLEIGPDSTPYFRSEVYLEMPWNDKNETTHKDVRLFAP